MNDLDPRLICFVRCEQTSGDESTEYFVRGFAIGKECQQFVAIACDAGSLSRDEIPE
ncbi:MAG TPA: hypothetical protein VII32_17265 [Thermoanaerobaculia bacterium]